MPSDTPTRTSCRASIDTTDSQLRVVVTDDGDGLPAGPFEGHGMQTMRERAEELGGTMQVTSPPGTTITALLPLRSPSPAGLPRDGDP